MIFSKDVYRSRRQTLMDRIGEDAAAILLANPTQPRSNDTNFPYRPDSNLLYLTGFTGPKAVAVFTPGASSSEYTLFIQKPTEKSALWDGSRPTRQEVEQTYGADKVYYLEALEDELGERLSDRRQLYYQFGDSEEFDNRILNWFQTRRHRRNKTPNMPGQICDIRNILYEMRLTKSPAEIEQISEAVQISSRAHELAMRHCRPGLGEHQLQAILEYSFYEADAEYPAYPIIVGSGSNATVLHYTDNEATISDGDVVLIDAGSEFNYYAGDITRSFPANGTFTPEQRDIYTAVLEAQSAILEIIEPGVPFNELQDTAVESLTESLVELGVLEGSVDEIIDEESYKDYFPHTFGHWMGMDVHDVGPYRTEDGDWKRLQEGMVLTVEPGLYFSEKHDDTPDKFEGIGIRIEDDIAVTEDGFRNLSADCPKDPDEIESIVGTDQTLIEHV